jgi:hypothetical protein
MSELSQQLVSIVENVRPRLRDLPSDQVRSKPSPGKWAKIEILGHLIDSTTNNHRRFVIANDQDNLIFDGYKQEQWVEIQSYLDRDWEWLVDFWSNSNLHLAHLISRLPEGTLTKSHQEHCLHYMAWKVVPQDVPATLKYLVQDYMGHLEHHLRQILPDYVAVVAGTYEYQA